MKTKRKAHVVMTSTINRRRTVRGLASSTLEVALGRSWEEFYAMNKGNPVKRWKASVH